MTLKVLKPSVDAYAGAVWDYGGAVFNVMHTAFGAKGDGTTDDAAAINLAITIILAIGGGVLYLPTPAVCYLVGSQITWATGVSVIGSGAGCIIKAKSGVPFSYVTYGSGITGCHFRGFTVDANGASRVNATVQCNGFVISGAGATECTFNDLVGINAYGTTGGQSAGALIIASSTRCTGNNLGGRDCGIPGQISDGVYLGGVGCSYTNVWAKNVSDTGIAIENAIGVKVTGFDVDDCRLGIGLSAASTDTIGSGFANGTIRNSTVSPASSAAPIICTNFSGAGVIRSGYFRDIVVRNTATATGPAVKQYIGGTGDILDMLYENVTVDGGAQFSQAFYMMGGKRTRLVNCKGFGVTAQPVYVDAGATDTDVVGGYFAPAAGQIGIYGNNAVNLRVFPATRVVGGLWSVYFGGTSTGSARYVEGVSPTSGYIGKDAGATVDVVHAILGTVGGTRFGVDAAATTGLYATAAGGQLNADVPVSSTRCRSKSLPLTYAATMNPDAATADRLTITVTNGSAYGITNPINGVSGDALTFTIKNTAGGAIAVPTFDTLYKLAAFVVPATGFNRSITFRYDGTNWVEVGRTTADVPN